MKRKPYVITENMKPPMIIDLINRAYEEGYEDGKAESTVVHETITTPWITSPGITTPLKDIQITDWPPNTIYCSGDTKKESFNG